MAAFHGPKMYGAVTVGERGQVVIPSELRESFGVKAGDKLIVFAKPGEAIGLIPADQFNEFLSHMSKMMASIKKEKTNNK
ncbi:MAG: AbrB/MazE/SpoVT family DNA-binding domain-containing protein [Candidatus Omnitrophica bacterium]|nr:AbrB/MazE/SpoVT family DNA-binding domain-containing protein [Candidatus Omnitrophota bacterium]MDD5352084.1 AbrB/MazE/SpoVT family DNA-binding domain-containing protein [Candidatus Omnitrophota bacterium]MDD5549682.1 AbrB/MazE/SpoVT family DNA-binding domain-containing protein [Candidatus Omnitrophota bacterium]